jgi:hypothetical protein
VERRLLALVQHVVDHLTYHYLVGPGKHGHLGRHVDGVAQDVVMGRPQPPAALHRVRVPSVLHHHVFADVDSDPHAHLRIVVLVQDRVYPLPHYLDHRPGAVDGVDAGQVIVVAGRRKEREDGVAHVF